MGLDSVELILAIEDAFGVDTPDADAGSLATVGQMADYLIMRVGAIAPHAREAVWNRLVDVVELQQGLDRARIVPEARYLTSALLLDAPAAELRR